MGDPLRIAFSPPTIVLGSRDLRRAGFLRSFAWGGHVLLDDLVARRLQQFERRLRSTGAEVAGKRLDSEGRFKRQAENLLRREAKAACGDEIVVARVGEVGRVLAGGELEDGSMDVLRLDPALLRGRETLDARAALRASDTEHGAQCRGGRTGGSKHDTAPRAVACALGIHPLNERGEFLLARALQLSRSGQGARGERLRLDRATVEVNRDLNSCVAQSVKDSHDRRFVIDVSRLGSATAATVHDGHAIVEIDPSIECSAVGVAQDDGLKCHARIVLRAARESSTRCAGVLDNEWHGE